MKRQLLVYGTVAVVALGVALVALPFLTSLGPNDRARSLLVPVDTANLAVGDVKVLDRDDRRIFVVHSAPGEFVALWVPIRDGIVMLPDMKWWRPQWPCKDFGPDRVQDATEVQIRFTCRDPDPPLAPREIWTWDGAGRYVGPANFPMDDMPRVRYERTRSQLLLKTS